MAAYCIMDTLRLVLPTFLFVFLVNGLKNANGNKSQAKRSAMNIIGNELPRLSKRSDVCQHLSNNYFPLPAQCNVPGYATFHILEGMMKHGFLILAVNVSESKALKPV